MTNSAVNVHVLWLTLLIIIPVLIMRGDSISDKLIEANVNKSQLNNGLKSKNQVRSAMSNNALDCRCQNGGVCIRLGFFCDCPTDFTGRFCQTPSGTLPCGSTKHGQALFDFSGDCQYCQCLNGTFNCDNAYTCQDLLDLQTLLPTVNSAHDRHTPLSLAFCMLAAAVLYSKIFAS